MKLQRISPSLGPPPPLASNGAGKVPRPCSARRADGSPCAATAMAGHEHCMFHNPEMSEQRASGRRQGGAARSQPRAVLNPDETMQRVRTIGDLRDLLADTINDVRTGRLDPRVANTVGYLSSVLVRVLEAGELEDRLAAVESIVKAGSGPQDSPLDHQIRGEEE
jgi:hypothetical protein